MPSGTLLYRRLRRFKSPGHAQRFLAAYGPTPPISARAATAYREAHDERFRTWHEVTGAPVAA